MMIRVAGIALPGLVLDDAAAYGVTGVRAVTRLTLGGAPVTWTGRDGRRPLDVVGGERFGWLPRATVDALQLLASDPAGVHALEHLDSTGAVVIKTVRFRHEEPPVIEATPRAGVWKPTPEDWMRNIRLKFEVVTP